LSQIGLKWLAALHAAIKELGDVGDGPAQAVKGLYLRRRSEVNIGANDARRANAARSRQYRLQLSDRSRHYPLYHVPHTVDANVRMLRRRLRQR
jgi:hypothetical protein